MRSWPQLGGQCTAIVRCKKEMEYIDTQYEYNYVYSHFNIHVFYCAFRAILFKLQFGCFK